MGAVANVDINKLYCGVWVFSVSPCLRGEKGLRPLHATEPFQRLRDLPRPLRYLVVA